MVVPYYKGVSESLKKSVANMVCRCTLKEVIPSRASWWPQRIKIQSSKRVGSSIDISVAGLTAMRNTYVNPQEHLVRGLKNIRRHPPQSMTIATSLVIKSPLIISTLLGGKTKTSAEQLKKHYTSGSIIHPSIEI